MDLRTMKQTARCASATLPLLRACFSRTRLTARFRNVPTPMLGTITHEAQRGTQSCKADAQRHRAWRRRTAATSLEGMPLVMTAVPSLNATRHNCLLAITSALTVAGSHVHRRVQDTIICCTALTASQDVPLSLPSAPTPVLGKSMQRLSTLSTPLPDVLSCHAMMRRSADTTPKAVNALAQRRARAHWLASAIPLVDGARAIVAASRHVAM